MSMAGLASLILLFLGRVICFTLLSQISPSLTRVRSLCSTSLLRKIRNPLIRIKALTNQAYKKRDNTIVIPFLIVDGGTVLLVRIKRHFMAKVQHLRHFSLCSLAFEPLQSFALWGSASRIQLSFK